MENLNVHAWVADGYKIYEIKKVYRNEKGYYFYGSKRNKSVYDDDFTTTHTEQIHMNWGWGKGNQHKDGWCTYDYWQSGKGLFNQNKEMITVNPH